MGLIFNKENTFHKTQVATAQETQIYSTYLRKLDSVSLYHNCEFFIELLAIKPFDQCIITSEYLKETLRVLLFKVCSDDALLSVLKAASPVNITYMDGTRNVCNNKARIGEETHVSENFFEEGEDSSWEDDDFSWEEDDSSCEKDDSSWEDNDSLELFDNDFDDVWEDLRYE